MNKRRAITILLAIAYATLLLKLIVFKYPPTRVTFGEANFVPFKTILMYLSGHPTWTVAWNNLAGNIGLFVPIGVLLVFISERSLKWIMLATISLSVGTAMEITQAVLQKGIFDIDDILLNAIGVAIGYLSIIWFIRFISVNFNN